ncbi:hypothetical protein [Paenibacillus elgii]|uniref:hypothetical protein n=1 Tax=Paenibacillus elgii TaxID=189691 RepID=UPI00203E323D|nr:hypothetical protein [Paenibacillus elgii]MCM3272625.1 hypothetical protein [Paenibacillus elgii]
MNRLVEKLDKSDDIAKEADQRAKSAHHRLDEVVKRLDATDKKIDEDQKEIRSGQRWLIGITISVAGLFFTAIGFLWKLKGGA